jgi:ABC-2 type transport system permease protein
VSSPLRTIRTVAAAEGRHLLRDGRFRAAALATLALLVAALGSGLVKSRADHETRRDAEAAMRRQWDTQPPRNPHGSAHYGMYAYRPVPPLAVFDRGLEPYVGTAMYLEAHYQNPVRYRPAEDDTNLARVGALTAAAVLQLGLPLLVIMLAAGTIAAERGEGTLRQVLASGVSPHQLVIGKAAGIALALGVVLVPAVILGVLALAATAPALDPVRVAGLILGYLGYLGVWLAVTFAISARARTAASSLLTVLAIWAITIVVVPVLAAHAAAERHPVPSSEEFWEGIEADMKETFQAHAGETEVFVAFRDRLLEQHGVTRVQDLPVGFWGLVYLESERAADAVHDRHYRRLWDIYERQQRMLAVAALVSPYLAIRHWSSAMAGSDLAHHGAFVNAAETYRREINRQLNEHLAVQGRGTAEYFADETFWRTLPAFNYQPPAGRWAVETASWASTLLLLQAVAVAGAAMLAAGRMRL